MTNSSNERLISVLFGAGIGASQLYVALCHITEADMKVAAIAIAVATGFGAYRFIKTWRLSKVLGSVLLLGIALGEVFGQVQTAERILNVRDERARAIKTENQPYAMAKTRIESAKQELQRAIDLSDKATVEVLPVVKSRVERRQNETNLNGKRSRLAADVQAKRETLTQLENALLKLDAPKIETKLAAKLGIAADVIDLGIAGIISVTMLAFVLVFLAMGHNNTVTKEKQKRGRPIGSKDKQPRKRRSLNVVRLVPKQNP